MLILRAEEGTMKQTFYKLSTNFDSTFLEDNLAVYIKSLKGDHLLWVLK